MSIDTAKLPTHIALVGRRLNACHEDDLANWFLETSYLAEVSIKTLAVALCAALRQPARELAYRHAYELVRADGLGTWETAIREITTQPTAAYLPPEFFKVLAWVTKKRTKPEDEWFREALAQARSVLRELGSDDSVLGKSSGTVKDLLSALVQIRNKTKAHGAVGQNFYERANASYFHALRVVVERCPAFSLRWLHLSRRESGKIRAVRLSGLEPRHMRDSEGALFSVGNAGIYVASDQSPKAFYCGDLLRSDREYSTFALPNGGVKQSGEAEFIDYASGKTSNEPIAAFLSPPVPLAASETEGMSALDVQSNAFGNLPTVPSGYVQRKALEEELMARVKDRNHPIITLHGGGGMGKTTLAIYVAHEIARLDDTPFEHIVWFSARDIDLRLGGPASVRPSVVDLDSVARKMGELFSPYGTTGDIETFARLLESPADISQKGILFVFDNFETMSDVRSLHKFLDEHTHLPNKVVITSRERAFKADYPIEVRGMESDEAAQMLHLLARELNIEGLMTDNVIDRIYEYTGGHAYVMRIIAGEMAKEGRYTPPAQLIGKRGDIVDAVFERSFNSLSDAGRVVFLIVSNWKAEVSELALLVVLGVRGIDASSAIDECKRLSLVFSQEFPGGEISYSAPQLARVYGKKKLQGDPDRLVIQEDLATLQKFGAINLSAREEVTQEKLITRFIECCFEEIDNGNDAIARADKMLLTLANTWPPAWQKVAEFRQRIHANAQEIAYALRRAVEEQPFSKEAWLKRAAFAAKCGDSATHIASLVSAVEADPTDVPLIREVAFELCRYVNAHLYEIPKARRGVYLASVRSHMEKVADKLDAEAFSRLSWLFLLEEKVPKAREYAERGCRLDPTHAHCLKILERLDNQISGRADLF